MSLPSQGPGGANNGTGSGANGSVAPLTQPAGANVPPGPVPQTFNVGQAQLSDGRVWVFLQINSPVGTYLAFLPQDAAQALGKELLRLASAGQILLGQPPPLIGG